MKVEKEQGFTHESSRLTKKKAALRICRAGSQPFPAVQHGGLCGSLSMAHRPSYRHVMLRE
jgi:hypothetical protein